MNKVCFNLTAVLHQGKYKLPDGRFQSWRLSLGLFCEENKRRLRVALTGEFVSMKVCEFHQSSF